MKTAKLKLPTPNPSPAVLAERRAAELALIARLNARTPEQKAQDTMPIGQHTYTVCPCGCGSQAGSCDQK